MGLSEHAQEGLDAAKKRYNWRRTATKKHSAKQLGMQMEGLTVSGPQQVKELDKFFQQTRKLDVVVCETM